MGVPYKYNMATCVARPCGKYIIPERKIRYRLSPIGDNKIKDKVSDFVNKGVVEWHTHWHGILNPYHYVNSWFPMAGTRIDYKSDETFDELAAYSFARDAIVGYFVDLKQKRMKKKYRERVNVPEYRDIIGILNNGTETKDQMYDFVRHILSTNAKDALFSNSVHWNWTYDFRRIIRLAAVANDELVKGYHIVPLNELKSYGKIKKWLDDDKVGNWKIDIEGSVADMTNDDTFKYKSIDATADPEKTLLMYDDLINTANKICEEYMDRWRYGGKQKKRYNYL